MLYCNYFGLYLDLDFTFFKTFWTMVGLGLSLKYCCNLSGGVALIVWFTTNGMCVKNNTIIYVVRTSNSKRVCEHDLYCCLLPQCEALCTCRSGFPIATVFRTGSGSQNFTVRSPLTSRNEHRTGLGLHRIQTETNFVEFGLDPDCKLFINSGFGPDLGRVDGEELRHFCY